MRDKGLCYLKAVISHAGIRFMKVSNGIRSEEGYGCRIDHRQQHLL
jgi:hypothetical protein